MSLPPPVHLYRTAPFRYAGISLRAAACLVGDRWRLMILSEGDGVLAEWLPEPDLVRGHTGDRVASLLGLTIARLLNGTLALRRTKPSQ